MATFGQIADNLKKIDFDVIFNRIFSAANIQKWITDTISQRIQQTGIDSEGERLQTDLSGSAEPYSFYTTLIKAAKGQKTNIVTLKDTGEFWQSMRIALIQGGININADFIKEDGHMYSNFGRSFQSESDYEEKIMGLTDIELENMLKNMINDMLIKEMNAAI